jgi:hypothetical protein
MAKRPTEAEETPMSDEERMRYEAGQRAREPRGP